MATNSENSQVGLSPQDEIFAIRLLEFARFLEPEGNRVRFVQTCEEQGIRSFLQGFPEVWVKITDSPEREGIVPNEQFLAEQRQAGLQATEFLVEALGCLERAGIPALAFNGPSNSVAFLGQPLGGRFQEVDLLVAPERVNEAVDALCALNLRPGTLDSPSGQRAAWYRYGGAEGLYQEGGGFHLLLHWRPLSMWVGDELLDFDALWSRRRKLSWGEWTWAAPSSGDTLLLQVFQSYAQGFHSLHHLLDIALALDSLESSWSGVVEQARYRKVMLERGVEMCVRLLGVAHPGEPTHYYNSPRQVVQDWAKMQRDIEASRFELLRPNLWSCDSGEAIWRSWRALSWPDWEDIQPLKLSPGAVGLYRLVALFQNLRSFLLHGL